MEINADMDKNAETQVIYHFTIDNKRHKIIINTIYVKI